MYRRIWKGREACGEIFRRRTGNLSRCIVGTEVGVETCIGYASIQVRTEASARIEMPFRFDGVVEVRFSLGHTYSSTDRVTRHEILCVTGKVQVCLAGLTAGLGFEWSRRAQRGALGIQGGGRMMG